MGTVLVLYVDGFATIKNLILQMTWIVAVELRREVMLAATLVVNDKRQLGSGSGSYPASGSCLPSDDCTPSSGSYSIGSRSIAGIEFSLRRDCCVFGLARHLDLHGWWCVIPFGAPSLLFG